MRKKTVHGYRSGTADRKGRQNMVEKIVRNEIATRSAPFRRQEITCVGVNIIRAACVRRHADNTTSSDNDGHTVKTFP